MLLLLTPLARMTTPLDAKGKPEKSAAGDEAHKRIHSQIGALYIFRPRRNGYTRLDIVYCSSTYALRQII